MDISDQFVRYTKWLAHNVPHAFANLGEPATSDELAALELQIGGELPEDVKTVLRLHNGQRQTLLSNHLVPATPCLPTLSFLSTNHIAEIWREWDRVRKETAP